MEQTHESENMTPLSKLSHILDLMPETNQTEASYKLIVAWYVLEIQPMNLPWALMIVYKDVPPPPKREPTEFLVITSEHFYFVIKDYNTRIGKYNIYKSSCYGRETKMYQQLRRYIDTYVVFEEDNDLVPLLKWPHHRYIDSMHTPGQTEINKIVKDMFELYLHKYMTVRMLLAIGRDTGNLKEKKATSNKKTSKTLCVDSQTI